MSDHAPTAEDERSPDEVIISELGTLLAEKEARIAVLESIHGECLPHVVQIELHDRMRAAESKLRAVSDALDVKPGSIPMEGHYVCFEDAVSEYIDGIRAIVEGK